MLPPLQSHLGHREQDGQLPLPGHRGSRTTGTHIGGYDTYQLVYMDNDAVCTDSGDIYDDNVGCDDDSAADDYSFAEDSTAEYEHDDTKTDNFG